MKVLIALILSVTLLGCWSGETVFKERFVPFVPQSVKDSIAQSVLIASSRDCDSLIQKAVEDISNFSLDQINSEGDRWSLIVRAVRDSAKRKMQDSLRQVLSYRRGVTISVQPHKDSVTVLFPVKEMRPWHFWEQVRLAIAWPAAFVLLLSIALNFFFFLRRDITQNILKKVAGTIG